jgi:hypothetical protein
VPVLPPTLLEHGGDADTGDSEPVPVPAAAVGAAAPDPDPDPEPPGDAAAADDDFGAFGTAYLATYSARCSTHRSTRRAQTWVPERDTCVVRRVGERSGTGVVERRAGAEATRTSHAHIELLRLSNEQCCGLAVQRVRRVRVPQQLREKDVEHVDEVEHGRPAHAAAAAAAAAIRTMSDNAGRRETGGGAATAARRQRSGRSTHHVWLITSKQTEPERSSTLGWKMRFRKPMDGDLKGYSTGSDTSTLHSPPSYGAAGRANRTR